MLIDICTVLGFISASENWVEALSALPQKTLKVFPTPLAIGAAVIAPPVPEDRGSPTVEYTCGGCGAAFDQRIERLLSLHSVDYVRGYVDALKDASSGGGA
jgi:hypothetical protein